MAKPEKRKRIFLMMEQKLQILQLTELGVAEQTIASEFGIAIRMVRDIYKERERIRSFAKNCSIRTRRTMRAAKHPQLDAAMSLWFQQEKAEGKRLSVAMCLAKAKGFFAELKLKGTFQPSARWLTRFKKRYEASKVRVAEGQQPTGYVLGTLDFIEELGDLVNKCGYLPQQIYAAAETGLWWRALPPQLEGTAPMYRISEDSITVLCCSNATGEDKLPLAVIGKSKQPRYFEHLEKSHLPVNYIHHHTSRMNSQIFETWFTHVFVPHVRRYLSLLNLPCKAVLLLDTAPSHPTLEKLVSDDGEICVHLLRPNAVSQIQPMDQGIVESFKRLYRKHLMLKMVDEASSLTEFWMSLTIKDAIFTVANAWDDVEVSMIQKAFGKVMRQRKVTRKRKNRSGNEFGVLSDEDVVLLAKVKEIEGCEELDKDGLEEWFGVDRDEKGYQVLTDHQIVENVKGGTAGHSVQDEESDDGLEPSESVTDREALSAAETLLAYYECQGDVDLEEILNLRKRIRKIKTKIVLERKQSQTFWAVKIKMEPV